MMPTLVTREMTQLLACVMLLGVLAGRAQAAQIVIDTDPLLTSTIDLTASSDMIVGFQFTAKTDIVLDGLGWTDTVDGTLHESHTIGLWELDGTLLASAVVTPFSPLTSTLTRTESITPAALSSGSTYVLGGTISQYVSPAASDFYGVITGTVADFIDPRITFDGSRQMLSSALAFPTVFSPGNPGYIGPNARFAATPVPEPSSLALMGLGLAGMAGARWRRRRRGEHAADGPVPQSA